MIGHTKQANADNTSVIKKGGEKGEKGREMGKGRGGEVKMNIKKA